jgi:hypothetical protein
MRADVPPRSDRALQLNFQTIFVVAYIMSKRPHSALEEDVVPVEIAEIAEIAPQCADQPALPLGRSAHAKNLFHPFFPLFSAYSRGEKEGDMKTLPIAVSSQASLFETVICTPPPSCP